VKLEARVACGLEITSAPKTTTAATFLLATMANEQMLKDEQEEAMEADFEILAPEFTSAFAQHSTVTLLVGSDEEPLVAHESYLTKSSEFFKTAMKKEWAEGQARVIKCPEDDLETMTDYLTFTYTGTLPTSNLVEGCPTPTYAAWTSLAKLYILGDRVLDTRIRNAVVSEIVRISTTRDKGGHTNFMGTAVSNMPFDSTPEGSPIRRLIVDEYVCKGRNDWINTEEHPGLMLGLARVLLGKVYVRQPYREFRGRQIKAEDYFV
jgi:hypothetical protein